MKILFRTLVLLAVVGSACANEPPPVLLIVHDDIGATTPSGAGGLLVKGIGAWANHFVNKQSAVKVARFHNAIGDMDLPAEASRVFGCIGATEECRQVAFTDAASFESALVARADKAGFVVEITPELVADQMLIRGVSHAVVLSDKRTGEDTKPRVKHRSVYIAIFNTRPPAEVAALRKTRPAELEQYWVTGEPRRLVREVRRGLVEINSLFMMLAKDGRAGGKMPDAWKSLPKVKEFKKSGRIACSGPAWCARTYVLKDNGDSFVLVSSGSAAGFFDAAAAAKETNLPFFALMGIPGN
jgi:hypothetical protein